MSISWILGGIIGGGNQQQTTGSTGIGQLQVGMGQQQGAFINQAQQVMQQGFQGMTDEIKFQMYFGCSKKEYLERELWNMYLDKCNNVTKETK